MLLQHKEDLGPAFSLLVDNIDLVSKNSLEF